MPPIIMTPLIALAPDIRGVWRTDGTLEITSNPKKDGENNNKYCLLVIKKEY